MADQKLNIIFTGDVSQLNKAMQSVESELTKLDAKLKDSLGAEGFAQINKQVDLLRQKFTALQAIDIKANPQQALTAINEILVDISKLKSNELIITSDNTDVLSDINEIQTRLRDVKSNIKVSADLDTSRLETLIKPLSTSVNLDVNTKAAEAELKALITQVNALKGKDILININGTQVIRTVEAIEKELLQLQARLKSATNPADVIKLTQQLQVLKNSLSTTNTNQFSSSMNRAQNATFAFSQVLREAPAFAFSFQTGILALSNNLPILADRFKEARAAGLSTGSIFRDMAKSLVSLPGLLTIASTALIFFGDKLFNSGNKAEDAAEKIRSYGEIVGESTAGVQGDIAQINALVNAFKESEGSFDKQNRIIKELKSTNEAYFGDLKAGKTTFEQITAAANKYTEALVAQAVVKGFSDEISKVSTELSKQKEKLKPLAIGLADVNKQLQKIRDPQARERQRATNFYTLEFAKQLEVVENLQAEFNRLGTEMQGAVASALKFKPLKGDPLPKDETDKIIARARAFVKQFGEVFVTPDLDESFTNTRDKILAASKKLLDDVRKKNLKIKLPLTVDLFTNTETNVPIEITIDPNFKLSDDIRERIIKEIESQLKPIDEAIDVTFLSKDQAKQIDDLTKQFVELGDRGLRALQKIDFTDVNKGIAYGKVALSRLNEELQITQEFSLAVGESFAAAFNALLEGENPIKAFFKSIIAELQRLIAKIIATKIAMGILKLAFPGGGSAIGAILGGAGNQANFGFGGGSGLRAFDVNITGSVINRGTDQIISFSNGGRSLGRIQ